MRWQPATPHRRRISFLFSGAYRVLVDNVILTNSIMILTFLRHSLLPVEIPASGPKGALILFPHVRPIRRHYYSSLFDKLVLANKLSQTTLRAAARRRRLGAMAIRLQPGTVYFFWGYRSIHANEPCEPDKLRVTALFHYGDPHRNSSLQALINYARGRNT